MPKNRKAQETITVTGFEYKPREYSGDLAKPINLAITEMTSVETSKGELGLLNMSSNDVNAFMELFQSKQRKKMPALFEFFEIDPKSEGAWEHLAFALACKHVPGFSFVMEGFPNPERRGRPKKWDKTRCMQFLTAVELLKKQKKAPLHAGDAGVCSDLAKKFPKAFLHQDADVHSETGKLTAKTLLNRLIECRKTLGIQPTSTKTKKP
jgi:hypothetical protein